MNEEKENQTADQVADQSPATEQKKAEPWVITPEEAEAYEKRCIELATKYNVPKVHCCVFIRKDDPSYERLAAYVKEPDYMSKLSAIDKSRAMGPHIAGETIRLVDQLTEESHPLTYSDLPEFELYKLGVTQLCVGIIEVSINHLKKN